MLHLDFSALLTRTLTSEDATYVAPAALAAQVVDASTLLGGLAPPQLPDAISVWGMALTTIGGELIAQHWVVEQPDNAPLIAATRTEEGWRGQGMARTTLAALLVELSKRGHRSVRVAVGSRNRASFRLFRSLNFEIACWDILLLVGTYNLARPINFLTRRIAQLRCPA